MLCTNSGKECFLHEIEMVLRIICSENSDRNLHSVGEQGEKRVDPTVVIMAQGRKTSIKDSVVLNVDARGRH